MSRLKYLKVDYNNGKVYKLTSAHTDKIYVGGTAQYYLTSRLSQHRYAYEQWTKRGKPRSGNCTSYEMFEYGNVDIELLEQCKCEGKHELKRKEQEWIEKLKDQCVNNRVTIGREPERRRKWKSQYDSVHGKEYKRKHREDLRVKQRAYFEKNKEKWTTKVLCLCGDTVSRAHIRRHERTERHRSKLSQTECGSGEVKTAAVKT